MLNVKDYHSIKAIKEVFKSKVPDFVYQYVETGTGDERALKENREAFTEMMFVPRFCRQIKLPNLSVKLFDLMFDAPIGFAPIGMAGLVYPKAEQMFAEIAESKNIPFCLSTVGTQSPEEIDAKSSLNSSCKWFQLYPPKDKEVLDSLIDRARKSGFSTLVVTVDIPAPSRRERFRGTGVKIPLKLTMKLLRDVLVRPNWLIKMLTVGFPRFRTVENYTQNNNLKFSAEFIGSRLGGIADWQYMEYIRSNWKGKLIIKGLVHPQDAIRAKDVGCDAVYISNHGGRQFDGVVSPLRTLSSFRTVLGKNFPIIFDSGIRSGLDVFKALSKGASFVMIGRAAIYGMGAFGKDGGERVFDILIDQLRNNMMQMGIEDIEGIQNIESDQKFNKTS